MKKAKLNQSDVIFPYHVNRAMKETKIRDMTFVSLVDDPSFAFITKRPGTKGISGQLIRSIWNAWPVLVVALLLSLHAGVLLWMLVSS